MTWTHQTYLITMLTDWEASQTEQSWNVRRFLYEWASERLQAFVYQTSRDSDTIGLGVIKDFAYFFVYWNKRYWYKYSCVIITPMMTVNFVCGTVRRDCPPKRLVKYSIFSIYLKSEGHCWQRHNPYSPLPLPRPSEPTRSVTLIWLVTWSGDYSVLLESLFSRGFSVKTTRLYAQNMQISLSLRCRQIDKIANIVLEVQSYFPFFVVFRDQVNYVQIPFMQMIEGDLSNL